ncbi:MAG: VOC family protein [Magnetovibrio sp.]|nr:VOC family protein [Magnetovibrio sp.]
MLKLDHLAVVAPTLEEGVEHVWNCLGVEMGPGGQHPQMGTHNRLLRLGDDIFLEVIAIDPKAQAPVYPRWFGLDERDTVRSNWDQGLRLRAWVAQTQVMDEVLIGHSAMLGHKVEVSRGDRSWHFSVRPDGLLPMGGAIAPVIDWGVRGNPAPDMEDLGAELVRFGMEHPDPSVVNILLDRLEVLNPPTVIEGKNLRFFADIGTPNGIRRLT